jgi:hypothetical protein
LNEKNQVQQKNVILFFFRFLYSISIRLFVSKQSTEGKQPYLISFFYFFYFFSILAKPFRSKE